MLRLARCSWCLRSVVSLVWLDICITIPSRFPLHTIPFFSNRCLGSWLGFTNYMCSCLAQSSSHSTFTSCLSILLRTALNNWMVTPGDWNAISLKREWAAARSNTLVFSLSARVVPAVAREPPSFSICQCHTAVRYLAGSDGIALCTCRCHGPH